MESCFRVCCVQDVYACRLSMMVLVQGSAGRSFDTSLRAWRHGLGFYGQIVLKSMQDLTSWVSLGELPVDAETRGFPKTP